ncbi:tetratricopeptide repeat protein, partial [Azospirillum sp. B506]|uniref:tetratricopeptide repeat protein n=1 Tax=Azospirillum sp. B506 TaxID=137721 RepID=UPI0005B258B5
MTVADLLEAALALHRAGEIAGALALYRRILTDDPAHADALHLAAIIAFQTGRTAEALSGLGAALAVQPRFPTAYNSL